MKLCIALVGSAFLASSAWAADPSGVDTTGADTVGHWYIAPQIGWTMTDSSRSVDNDSFYGLIVGKHLSDDWSAELNLVSGKYDGRDLAPGMRITATSADVLRVFDRDSMFSPFLTAGLGVIVDHPQDGGAQGRFMAQAGAGALIHLWENESGSMNFSLRPEAKVRWDANSNYQRPVDVLLGIGFELAFGAPRPVSELPSAPPAPPPAPATPEAVPSPPPPAASAAPASRPVESIVLEGVHFANDSARLTPESSAILDPIAASLQAHPELRVEVQGHTDGVGSAAYNLKLSQARANAVRDYLIAHGVPEDELTAVGYGKTRPIADNATAAGRARNRRVVLVVLENPSGVEIKGRGEEP